jgi:hypothetical protein
MGLDIRWPIGYMFLLLGIVLAAYGLLGDSAIYAQSLGVNVNLIWGAVLGAFGIVMLLLARFGEKSQQKIPDAINQNDRPSSTH